MNPINIFQMMKAGPQQFIQQMMGNNNVMSNPIVWVDNKSSLLSRTDGSMSVGVTDMNTHCIYLAKSLHGAFLRKVIIHELCHCVCMSYNIYMPIEQEEMLCDFVATYGDQVFEIVDILTGYMGDRMYG